LTGKIMGMDKGQYHAWIKLQDVIEETIGYDHLPCAQAPDLYHPSNEDKYYANMAIAACNDCPIKLPCATYAIAYEKEGIWGGLSASERIRIRRSGKISMERKVRRL
jgi:hypothetical protein